MKVMDFKTLCNFISKGIAWTQTSVQVEDNMKVTRWTSDDKAIISISECIDYELVFVIVRPPQTAKSPSPQRSYLTPQELNYIHGLLERRQCGSFREQWPLSLITEMRGGDKYVRIKTTFDTTAREQKAWKHLVAAFPGDGKAAICYEAESAGTDGTKLHNTLVRRIYRQLLGEPQ